MSKKKVTEFLVQSKLHNLSNMVEAVLWRKCVWTWCLLIIWLLIEVVGWIMKCMKLYFLLRLIHFFIHFILYYLHIAGCGWAGVNPHWYWMRGRVHPGQTKKNKNNTLKWQACALLGPGFLWPYKLIPFQLKVILLGSSYRSWQNDYTSQ